MSLDAPSFRKVPYVVYVLGFGNLAGISIALISLQRLELYPFQTFPLFLSSEILLC